MAVMVLVVLASLGALFLVGLLIMLDRDGARTKRAEEESFILLEQKPRPGPRLVRSASSKGTWRVPLQSQADSVGIRPADRPSQQSTQAR
jgi:hypothetical protein